MFIYMYRSMYGSGYQQRGQGKWKTMNKDPNDASSIVWALDTCFFLVFIYFILTNVYIHV
jgi:hypothetical protein